MKPIRFAAILLGLALSFAARAADAPSLYHEDTFQPLTSDRKARAVGDLITVQVYEDASATSSADTTTGRAADVGAQVSLPLPHTSPFHGNHQAGASTSNDFSGKGQTERSGRVVAQITVPVVGRSPNGDLVIAGTQELEINGEKQRIHIEGRVRSADVSATNTVLSSRVADARLSVVGDGTLNDQQKPAWWQRLLTMFGL